MSDDNSPSIGFKWNPGPDFGGPGHAYMRELIAFHDIAPSIPSDQAKIVEGWMIAHRHFIAKDDLAEVPSLIDKIVSATQQVADYMAAAEAGNARGGFEEIKISSPHPEPHAFIGQFLMELTLSVLIDRAELVGRAFLISAISSFEVLFGNLVRAIYGRNPTALSTSEHAFTLEELSQYTSIQEAREALVTKKVEELLMESVDTWGKWLKRTINIEITEIVEQWSDVREIFARRNILVHADGKVNQRYIQVLQSVSADTTELSIGQKLKLSLSYLQESLERLIAFGAILNFAVWSRLYKTRLDEAVQWMTSSQEFLIRHEMWTATQQVSRHLATVDCRRSRALSAQINGWLARKRLQGVESIREDILAWDISGLTHKYEMIKCLLIDDNEKAKEHILAELQAGKLTRFEIATHPLYSDFRLSHSLDELDNNRSEPSG